MRFRQFGVKLQRSISWRFGRVYIAEVNQRARQSTKGEGGFGVELGGFTIQLDRANQQFLVDVFLSTHLLLVVPGQQNLFVGRGVARNGCRD